MWVLIGAGKHTQIWGFKFAAIWHVAATGIASIAPTHIAIAALVGQQTGEGLGMVSGWHRPLRIQAFGAIGAAVELPLQEKQSLQRIAGLGKNSQAHLAACGFAVLLTMGTMPAFQGG